MTLRLTILAGALLLLAVPARAEFSVEKLALVDRPFAGDSIALSPDGRYLAYSVHVSGQLSVVMADLERGLSGVVPLNPSQASNRAHRQLRVLRWLPGNRLLLQNDDGEVAAIDADSGNPMRLWNPRDNGIINDYDGIARFAVAAPPRILPVQPGDPDTILLESSAILGFERLANLYRVDVRTGVARIAHQSAFYAPGQQVALYGPGDQIGLPNPDAAFFPVDPESSSTGWMLYDATGWPRLLHEQPPARMGRRRYSYTAPGRPPSEPNLVPISLDETLKQRTHRQEILGRVGEFDLRPTNYFAERSYPVSFGYDPDVVYLASSVGRDTYGIYALNLKTRERVEVAPEVKGYDLAPFDPDESGRVLVFDEGRRQLAGIRYTGLRPMTHWLDPELRELQAALEKRLPGGAVEIVSWDAARQRIALRVSSEQDPGAIFLYEKTGDRLARFAGRAPWLAGTPLKPSAPFTFETPAGVTLSGYVTLPTDSKADPPPLLIYCAAGLWDRAAPGFNREAEILADMGIVVIRLNYRGSAGFGRAHLTAIQSGMDTVPVEDLIAAIDWLAARRPIDRKRVVVMGEGYGGYLALRALQNHPDIFRAAISLNAPTNLNAWATRRGMTTERMIDFAPEIAPVEAEGSDGPPAVSNQRIYYDFRSLVREEFVKAGRKGAPDISGAVADGNFVKPVLLISNPRSNDLTPVSSLFGRLGLGLEGTTVQRLSISGNFVGGSFDTRSRVFRRIEEFLNESLYNFDTEIGTLREIRPPGK